MTSARAPKRLTYIVNYLSADDAQHFVHIPPLLEEMERLGWKVDLISERGGRGTTEVLGRRVKYLSRTSKARRLLALVRHLLAMRGHGGRLVFVRISRSAALVSALLGRIFGWKTVFWVSGTVEDYDRSHGSRLNRSSLRRVLHLVDRLVTGPETMIDYYAETYQLPRDRIALLYNDIDLARSGFRRSAAPSETKVLLVHRLSPVRETGRYLPELLRALGEHAGVAGRPVTLDICGDGPERAELEQIAANAPFGVEIRFHGAVPQRDLASFYERASLFVMPSYREGFPRVMLEAMARGLPIVATDAGGTRDLCGPAQRHLIVSRDDPQGFGDAIAALLSSPEEQDRLAEENLTTVKRFDTPVVARMYDRVLSKLIGAAPAP